MTKANLYCPHCEAQMVPGCLKIPNETVYVESQQSSVGSSLAALICLKCGYVELRALDLENLARYDISEQELGRCSLGERLGA